MPRTSKNKFEIINDEIHISKEGWPLIGLTTYREDYYEELTSKTWTLTKANSETDDKGYLSNKTLGLLHRYIVAKWYGQDVLDTMTQKGFVVDHLNNNHTDCRISNLEFLKKAYNTAKGQAFDVDSKMMEHHIAVNIFKDFSTGCYQITIGCNDDIVGETKDGKKYHIKVSLGSCAGIFPTITKFGMAALLPHKQLSINERSNGDLQILADGMSTDAGNRDKVLKATNSNSVALKYKDIAPMKRAERSALVKGMDVVYIYHDKVDEASHTSDSMVFSACDDAIEEIKNIVRIIRNEFSGTRVYITADHGFLYTYSPLSEDAKVDKEEKAASASMVFVGNINQSVDVLLKTSSLFDPFPPEMGTDTAFLDRMHCYLPGWEIPKFRPEHFTNDYGFISDYLAEFIRELRKEQYGDAIDHYFRLGKNLNQRDTIAVRRMADGYLKLLYPDGSFTKEEVEEVLQISLEMRRRVKEQLKKLGGMEFYDVNFSYIDNETFEEHYVSVPEQGGGKLIPEGMCNPGQIYTVSQGKSGMLGVFRLESQMLPGNGKFERTGIGSDRDAKEATNTAFNFLKANGNRISGSISTTTKDYIINYQDLQGIGMTGKLALPTLIAMCSIALGKPTLSSLAVLGEISISGTMMKVDELANSLQVCLDSGAKRVLLPITSAAELGTVPADLIGSFNLIFYSSAEDAVFKALGVE